MEATRVSFINPDADISPSIVAVAPSSNGILGIHHPKLGRLLGESVILYGITNEQHLDRLDTGDQEVLDEYLQPDPDKPGVYTIVNCHAKLVREGKLILAGPTIEEYVPVCS